MNRSTMTARHFDVQRTHGFEPLRVEGQLPAGLQGTLYRVGPGVTTRFGHTLSHPFEADGAMTAVRFGEGGVDGACRVVKSAGYREEEAAGRYLYGSAAPWWRRFLNMRKRRVKTTGNTNVLWWDERLFALMEAGPPQEMDPTSLDTLDAVDLGVVRGGFSAHPHRVAALQTTFNFGVRFGRTMEVDLFALPDAGRAWRIGTFTAPWPAMLHDFAATEKHLVFVVAPAKLTLWKALLGAADLRSWFRWDPSDAVHLVVVPLDDPDRPRVHRLAPFWSWHTANAYERGSELVVELVRHPDFGSFRGLGGDDVKRDPARLWRYVIGDRVVDEPLWDGRCEFPTVDPRLASSRAAATWLQVMDGDRFGIARVAPDGTSRSWQGHDGWDGSEPVFVPIEGAGDVVLSLVRAGDASFLAVFDADRFEDGPVAKVWFDHPIPSTFHGAFVPA